MKPILTAVLMGAAAAAGGLGFYLSPSLADVPTTDTEAEKQFLTWTRYAVPAGEQQRFALNVDFPTVKPAPRALPWDTISFSGEPDRFLRSVLGYCLQDAKDRDFIFSGSKRWFHAPWLAREPLRGLTNERSSKKGELAVGLTGAINLAVGYYNDLGAWAFSRVWADRGNPKPAAVDFPVGSVSCKLLFTDADPAKASYLKNSLEWRAAPGGQPAKVFRLLQFDVGVRVNSPQAPTGWVFGTFLFLGDPAKPKPFAFEDLVPVGLMWGNDPDLGPIKAKAGVTPVQGWVNPVVAAHFKTIRSQTPGLSTDLGLFGRVNGPVDNSRSSCLACHGRALDGGAGWTEAARRAQLPFEPPAFDAQNPTPAQDTSVKGFFRNLTSTEPFLPGKQSLDYSLQLAVGLENYHQWRQSASPALMSHLLSSSKTLELQKRNWINIVPEAEQPKRGDEPGAKRERGR